MLHSLSARPAKGGHCAIIIELVCTLSAQLSERKASISSMLPLPFHPSSRHQKLSFADINVFAISSRSCRINPVTPPP